MLVMPAAIEFLYRSGSSLIVISLLRNSFRMSVMVVGVWVRNRHGRNFCQADNNFMKRWDGMIYSHVRDTQEVRREVSTERLLLIRVFSKC